MLQQGTAVVIDQQRMPAMPPLFPLAGKNGRKRDGISYSYNNHTIV